MGFGQSRSEKQQDQQLLQTQGQMSDISAGQEARGTKAFKFFKQAAMPAKDFWSNILNAQDRPALEEALGPEISGIKSAYAGQRQQGADFGGRTARASGNQQLAQQEAGQIGNALLAARPMAAGQLGGLAGMFGGLSTGFTGQALSGLTGAANVGFGLNREQQAVRESQAQFWGGLGQAAGTAAGGWLGGKGGK